MSSLNCPNGVKHGNCNNKMKPHAVCVPFPAQGHINPMLKLAKLLHSRGFHITFVNTEYNHARLLRSRGPASLDGLPSFRFDTIPDGLPPTEADATQDIPSLCESTEKHSLEPFCNLLHHLNETAGATQEVPPVSCIVSDVSMFFTLDAAEEIGVPEVLLWTASVCGFLGYAQFDKLLELGITPFKDSDFLTNGELDVVLDWVPASMEGICLRDMPSFIQTTNSEDIMLGFMPRLVQQSKRATSLIFNSFDALEHQAIQHLSLNFPPIYTLGPLQLLDEAIDVKDEDTKSIASNLWKEDPLCLDWLDSHAPGTIMYVNFGSITVMTIEQLNEFAWGLANSEKPFLWITRPDLVRDSEVLSTEFLEVTQERGFIASWCNQEKVLAHPAVGGFLTHSGWNSTLESIFNGVPMICWPFFAEQQTNSWYCCRKWGIGMEIDTNVKRSEVEWQVQELLDGEKGKKMKRKAMGWKALAQQAAKGPSPSNLDHLITSILLSQTK